MDKSILVYPPNGPEMVKSPKKPCFWPYGLGRCAQPAPRLLRWFSFNFRDFFGEIDFLTPKPSPENGPQGYQPKMLLFQMKEECGFFLEGNACSSLSASQKGDIMSGNCKFGVLYHTSGFGLCSNIHKFTFIFQRLLKMGCCPGPQGLPKFEVA